MSVAPLPRVIEPLKLVEQHIDLDGTVPLSECDRLQEALLGCDGDIQVSLRFNKDEQGLRVITGTLQADVLLECQRCLQPFGQTVRGDIQLAIARHEDAVESLPRHYDPLLLEAPEIELWPLIEQELLLSLPIVAIHPEGECSIDSTYQEKDDELKQDKPNPFAVLAELKNQK